MMRAVVACVLVAGCISPVVHFGEGKTAKQAQHDTMSELGPARLVTGEKWNGEVETRKIRVWADQQYRTQNRNWQKSFEDPLQLANLVITPIFGLRLVAEYVVWDRHVPDATLSDDLAALQEQDSGNDVFAVVGLTSSLPLVSSTFEQLGLASLGGRHMMLRGYNDLEERKMYADAFPDLRAEERELALEHLRHHKTAVLLLHELGHNLGVEHETDSTSIMNASYSNHATAYTTASRKVMLHTVDQRLHRGSSTLDVAAAPPTPPQSSPSPQSSPPPPSRSPSPAPRSSSPESQSASAPAKAHHAPIVIRVTNKGTTIVDGKLVKADALDALLKATFAEDPETKIVINEDRKVPTGVVGDLIDRAKAIGFTKFVFGWAGQ